MKCMKVLMHQQPYKEILRIFGLEKLFSLRRFSSSWFLLWLDLSLWLPLWKSSCLITLEIWSLVLNLVLLSSKSRLTKPWFHIHNIKSLHTKGLEKFYLSFEVDGEFFFVSHVIYKKNYNLFIFKTLLSN